MREPIKIKFKSILKGLDIVWKTFIIHEFQLNESSRPKLVLSNTLIQNYFLQVKH